jgi:hypothetical protein
MVAYLLMVEMEDPHVNVSAILEPALYYKISKIYKKFCRVKETRLTRRLKPRANAFGKQKPGCSFSIGLNWEKQQM